MTAEGLYSIIIDGDWTKHCMIKHRLYLVIDPSYHAFVGENNVKTFMTKETNEAFQFMPIWDLPTTLHHIHLLS
jgi:hypothetical protein